MKKENKWPLWYKGCSFWCGPIKNIKNWFKNLHYFFVRGRMGWAPSDVWDMDMYLGKIIPEMLRHLATYHAAYPYQYKGINKEKDACTAWETDLYNLAQQIEFVAADRDNFNPYAKQFYNFLENKGSKPITNEQNVYQSSDSICPVHFRGTGHAFLARSEPGGQGRMSLVVDGVGSRQGELAVEPAAIC